MESITRTVNVLLTVFLWFIALVCLSLPAWLLYNSWNKGRLLNERLENCDDTLLSDSGVKVAQVISAPLGTTVTENATLVAVPNKLDQIV
ncbi:MAG: hypothetical protein ISP82_03305 [Candidatus Poseidoniaceae archaeon]|nr:hypothetical protein [Candidatus Poseidoniaceae archaeon]